MAIWIVLKLILEAIAGAAGTGAGWVAALDYKICNHAMKADTVVELLIDQEYKVIDRDGGS